LQIAAGESECCPDRSPEEDLCPGHDEHAENKADKWGRTSSSSKLFEGIRGDHTAENKSRNLRIYVLESYAAMKTESTCGTADETGWSEAGIRKIAYTDQPRAKETDRQTCKQNHVAIAKEIDY
jgi:hypothetical protein